MTHWFPDSSVIINFAHIGRLDLLRDHGRITQAVSQELVDSRDRGSERDLDPRELFGKPVRVTKDRMHVEKIRRHVFGGRRDAAAMHLGVSETLYLSQKDGAFVDTVWITENQATYDFAKANSIATRNTFDVLREGYIRGDLTRSDAFQYCRNLHAASRLIFCPDQEADLDR